MCRREKEELVRVLRLTLNLIYEEVRATQPEPKQMHYLAGKYQAYKEILDILEARITILQPKKK